MQIARNISYAILSIILLITNTKAKENISLEEITVTAQKSEENIQKVPISISAFDENMLEDNSILKLEDDRRKRMDDEMRIKGDV